MDAALNISNLASIFVAIIISIGVHEAMHGYVAHWLGDPTAHDAGRLTLNPLKHIDGLMTILLPVTLIALGLPPIFAAKPVPFNPARVKYAEYGAALIGLAGPFTNLFMALVAAALAHILAGGFAVTFLVLFVQVNIGFFVFNMLPIPPLDGSRLIYALVPESVQEVMARFEQMGMITIILILVVLMPVIGPVLSNVNQQILIHLL